MNNNRQVQRFVAPVEDHFDTLQSAIHAQAVQVQNTFKLVVTYSIAALGTLLVLIIFLTALIGNLHQFLATASSLMKLFLQYFVPGALVLFGIWFVHLALKFWLLYQHESLDLGLGKERLKGMQAERAREDKRVDAEVEKLRAEAGKLRAEADRLRVAFDLDAQGNKLIRNPLTGQVQLIVGQMREHPALGTLHMHNTAHDRTVSEVKPDPKKLLGDLHIPTFAESLRSGLIEPGQKEILICYELKRDEETGLLTGEIVPYTDKLENNCTMFLGGGSKSGKSTLMAHLAAQEALMRALFYIIDPHLTHPEKSVAMKLQALSHAFILPPAMTDAEIYTVLEHARNEAECRRLGKETPYSGRPIVFIVDEVLNLFGRAWMTPNKDIQALYRNLAFFLRDLGTQYNKYDVNGIFASQYVTKDAFKLPTGYVDFRDGCQNNTLLRLPPNQAQAMRLLQKEEVRETRTLPPGHGYMGFFTGEIIRMGFGNVTVQDINAIGRLAAHAPSPGKQFAPGTLAVPERTSGGKREESVVESTKTTLETPGTPHPHGPVTGTLHTPVLPLEKPVVPGTTPPKRGKQFTAEQELEFVRLFKRTPSIKACIFAMHLSYGDYQASASQLVARRKLRGV